MSQFVIHDETIQRIEKIIGRRFFRGGDRAVNLALDVLEGKPR